MQESADFRDVGCGAVALWRIPEQVLQSLDVVEALLEVSTQGQKRKLQCRWKERKERKHPWLSLHEAAKLIDELDPTSLLKELAKQAEKLTIIEEMRRAS